jgi:large subunit ribosomal protein L15
MNVNEVNVGITKSKKTKRRGRGIGSGHGKTATRGHKGQFGRSGVSFHPAFQGGAMPLVRRIPKRGFNNKFALLVREINVGQLEQAYAKGEAVTPESLKEKGILRQRYEVLKILGNGEPTKALKVSAHRFSESAKQKIEQAGGSTQVLPMRQPVVKGKSKSRGKPDSGKKGNPQ